MSTGHGHPPGDVCPGYAGSIGDPNVPEACQEATDEATDDATD
jgi:hypothetical protein